MRILDRQRYWAFLKAYVVCFTGLVGLYVVIHAFTNLDEFTKNANGTLDLFARMAEYYGIRLALFYDRLCGVIAMMAAIFTVTWMQRGNELLAMMAAGISAPRAIRPVLIASLIVSGLAVANQEFLLPRWRTEFPKKPDDDGHKALPTYAKHDVNDVVILGKHAMRSSLSMRFNATLPNSLTGSLRDLSAAEAIWVDPKHPTAPLRGGWLLRGAAIDPPLGDEPLPAEGPIFKVEPTDLIGFPVPSLDRNQLGGVAEQVYFLRTNVGFDMVTRERYWYEYATTKELLDALADPSNRGERNELEVALHHRLLRPALSFSLLALSLPLVLGGMSRNLFVNLGLAMATSAVFYGTVFMAQYLGNSGVLTPVMAAWSVLLVYGTAAYARWPTIRT